MSGIFILKTCELVLLLALRIKLNKMSRDYSRFGKALQSQECNIPPVVKPLV